MSPPVPGRAWRRFTAVFGPGLVVMLADTDVGSIVTAGQSGVQWGYRLLLLQFALMPLLYVVQELTVRLGLFTGRGHGALLRATFGPVWAWVSVAALAVASIGALLTEFSGIAGIGTLFGIPRAITLPLAAAVLLAVVLSGSYRRVERAAIAIGAFELAFVGIAWAARPDPAVMAAQIVDVRLHDPGYLFMVAANIGSAVMAWMIFYQQAATADKGLGPAHLAAARWDTAIGAVATQLVMAAVLVAAAATIGAGGAAGASLAGVGDLSRALTPFLGLLAGRAVFAAGVLGAALVAAIVASLALAWGLGEVTGYRRSLADRPLEARWFYAVYALCVAGGALAVAAVPDLVALTVDVQVMNALLLPLVLGLLIRLAMRALPAPVRLRGAYLWLVAAIATAASALGLWSAIGGLLR